jgi:CarD family transcriptional regulator
MEMFKIDDFIIYGSTGVCQITDIKVMDQVGIERKSYYVLKPLYQGGIVYTPVDNNKVFMRPIISSFEVEQLIDSIPSINASAYHCRESNQLIRYYDSVMKTHDCEKLMELTMSIGAKKKSMEQQKQKMGSVDERYMKLAEDVLFGELAAALSINRDDVPNYISARLAHS